MTTATLIWRSLRFHAKNHLGALLGAAVGTAVLVGALIVGDSVRQSLRDMALLRLGKVDVAVASGDRLFREQLARDLAQKTGAPVVSALQLPATAVNEDGTARANRAQVIGVRPDFWKMAGQPPAFAEIPPGSVVMNTHLARQLNVKVGDIAIFRVQKPSQLSRDAPMAGEENSSAALRLKVQAVASDGQFGRFSLKADQVPPFNAFVNLSELQGRAQATNSANLLLGAGDLPSAAWDQGLKASWTLEDMQVELRPLTNDAGVEIRSSRVFLDAPVAAVALPEPAAVPILTYFANELRIGERSTPYSMVAAVGAPFVPTEMKDEEILVNQWLADDLQAKPGDQIELAYYVVGTMRQLVEERARFRVRGILPMTGTTADRSLMPDFPGLTNAENCRDWDTGFPIKTDKIRDKDEKYWHDFRGTPKAFITLAAGQKMWRNRFGDLTAIRFPARSGEQIAALGKRLLEQVSPASVGLAFLPARAQALRASSQSQDFGQLFLGFSFFLILAALILMSMLFQFGLEQRATEVGTLLALGFTPKMVRRCLLGEGVLIATFGSLLGVAGGIFYAKAMLRGLTTIWKEAVGSANLRYFASPETLAIGAVSGIFVASLTIWWGLRRQGKRPARELLSSGGEEAMVISGDEDCAGAAIRPSMFVRHRALVVAVSSLVLALAMGVAGFMQKSGNPAEMFFGAGSLLLIAGLAGCMAAMNVLRSSKMAGRITAAGMGLRNVTRRRKRSRAVISLLACGSFLIASIGAFRLDENEEGGQRSSGTGGFAFIGETALPVVHDLNAEAGRQFFGLDPKAVGGLGFVAMRVREGEDASCLNLNRAQRPRLLGARPEALSQRKAFTFAAVASGLDKQDPWLLLHRANRDEPIPAIGDAASIQYALGKSVGDILPYVDERGREVKLRLVASVANSILQGSLIIGEQEFLELFPSESGYRMFLIDTPSNQRQKAAEALTKGLQDVGLELTDAGRRLAAFNAVQNTYLGTFQILGGLGLLLGTVGLGVVVMRNVYERRAELALLSAVGLPPALLLRMVIAEHAGLLLAGLVVGVVSALAAALPALLSPGKQFPYLSLSWTLGGVLALGLICTWLSAVRALRGRLLEALRNN